MPNRVPAPSTPGDTMDLSALRASLAARGPLPLQAAPPAPAGAPPAPRPAAPAVAAELAPDAVLSASPNVARLCGTYDAIRRRVNRRGRMQRLGLGGLLSAAMMAAAVLAQQHRIGMAVLDDVVIAAAVLGTVALGILAALWMRDERRARERQGDRLIRALTLNCTLPRERVDAWLSGAPASDRFFQVYEHWRTVRVA